MKGCLWNLVILTCALAIAADTPGYARAEINHDDPSASAAAKQVLVFSRTAGFRHTSIPNGIAAITELGAQNDFGVTATEDPTMFSDATLTQFDAVVFLNTTGDVLASDQEAAFERYIRAGNGYVGVHSAADTEYSWQWYGELVGAYFASHPAIQPAEVKILDAAHPSTDGLPRQWSRTDEWYNYQSNPRGNVHVLATLDETTYQGGTLGFDHPIAWCHTYDGGRAWYTGGGHTEESYDEPMFRQHLLGGINYATGAVSGDCQATIENSYRTEVVDENPSNPMGVAAAPDGRVFIIERTGRVRLYNPSTESLTTAAQLDVFSGFEDGLLGIVLDPNFDATRWIYLFYSPAGSVEEQRVSRFDVTGNTIDLSTERILLTIPVQRQQCCHSAGDLEFDPDGNLHISTGDNTNPFESDGYAPIDERAGRSPWDAQKSSSNIDDLRGKILRIRPEADGTYSIPQGNLFPADGSAGRPEIYAMGLRNPFRISIDPVTSWLYWGDVGPDASEDSFLRGPRGYDEWNQARTAGNFGWPYCIADNRAYRDYDFATAVSGSSFVCLRPRNDSPNNSGSPTLPAAKPAWIWYPYGPSTEFPEITTGPGRTALAGPVYLYSASSPSGALPSYFDGALFIYDWRRGWIKEVQLDDDGGILAINEFLPSTTFRRPIDLHVGPDGSIYVVEWGDGFGGNNPDARVNKITYLPEDGTGVEIETVPLPGSSVLHPVYPNPIRTTGDVSVTLAQTTRIKLAIYDVLGREVARVAEGVFSPGSRQFRLTSAGLASGTYMLHLTGLDRPIVRPFAVIK